MTFQDQFTKGGMKTNSFSILPTKKKGRRRRRCSGFTHEQYTHTRAHTQLGNFFRKSFFLPFESVEKSLKCPGNRLKSHQIHWTSIELVVAATNRSFYAILPLSNSQFPPENPRRKTFHVHFKDFPCNIWWMLSVTWSLEIFPFSRRDTFPAQKNLPALTHQMFWFW